MTIAAKCVVLPKSSMRDYTQLSPAAERIVDVAEALIQHQGFNGFSYEDIAQTVGIRKPSVHHHFATKADLATVVTQRYVQRFISALENLDRSIAEPRKRLLAYAQLFQETYNNNRHLCLCGMLATELSVLPDGVPERVRAFFSAQIAWLQQAIAMGQTRGELSRRRSAKQSAEFVLGTLQGAMLLGWVGKDHRGVERAVDELLISLKS